MMKLMKFFGSVHPFTCLLIAIVVLTGAATISSCYNEKLTTSPEDKIFFSTDTLSFDTVLTSISTVTRFFKVYNPHDLSIEIDEIRLEGPLANFFTLNVDGMS